MSEPFQLKRAPEKGGEEAEDQALTALQERIQGLEGPMKNPVLSEGLIASFKNAGEESRAKISALLDAYEKNVGAFFGALYGDPNNADIKLAITARETWVNAVGNFTAADVAFIFKSIAENPKLQALLPEESVAKIQAADFQPDAEKLMQVVDYMTNPDNPDAAVFVQRTFNQGIDPLAAIGGYFREEFAQQFSEDGEALLEATREAHHQGAMLIAYKANELIGKDFKFEDLSQDEKVAVLWSNTAELTELYGDEIATSPEAKWNDQVGPYTQLMEKLLATESSNPDTEAALVELAARTDIKDHQTFRKELQKVIAQGDVRLDSPALFKAAIAMEFTKEGGVLADPESHMRDLFYADTEQYPYLTMAFMGEKIGIQRVSKTEGALKLGIGETSMSLPKEIEAEMIEKFPFLNKHDKINLRRDGFDKDIPITGPSAQYIYINDGTFFDEPERVYKYKVGEEEREVKPIEILDFLREKREQLSE